LSGVGTNEISWGVTTGDQSGYIFEGNAPQADVSSPFDIGTFTHNNFVVAGAIESAILEVNVIGNVTEGPEIGVFNFTVSYNFLHDETPNLATVAACDPTKQASTTPCDDVVTITDGATSGAAVVVDGITYQFDIFGFSTDGGATISDRFLTQEQFANEASLYATFEATAVPLPAGVWLLLSGVGAMGIARRCRKEA